MGAIQAIAARELVTVARSRASLVLLVGVALVTAGIALGGEPNYLPTAVDLLLPMEFLVPAVAIALGYRTVVADARRGELDVLETYPVTTARYVVGVYLGRALALVVVLGVPLALVGVYLLTGSPSESTIFASHRGVDSPVVFVRFVALTLLFGFAILAMAVAASALAGSRRSALVLAVVVFGLVVLGLDLLVVRGFADGVVPEAQLTTLLAVSPTSAYRGLVFETVVSTAVETDLQQASVPLSTASLGLWTLGSLAVATLAVDRRRD